jgi:predicted hydrocarbon binding protein
MLRENKQIELSGLYYPNRIVLIYLRTLEDILNVNGLKAILNLAGLPHLIDNMPPDNLDRAFDFAYFSAINVALEEIYGVRGGRGLAQRAGRTAFDQGLKNFGALAGAGDLAFRVLPLPAKLKMGLPAMASIFNNFSDQKTEVYEKDDHYAYLIKKCPVCWGRKTDKPVCFAATGLLQGGLTWVSGGKEFRVTQTKCKASGDDHCEFVIFKEPISQ